jgi:hypothetical protein
MDIRSFARSQTRLAIRTLKAVAQDAGQPGTARVAAASALLDRGWGKPQQSHDLSGDSEIRVTIRHLVEGMPDTTQLIDITPEDEDTSSS